MGGQGATAATSSAPRRSLCGPLNLNGNGPARCGGDGASVTLVVSDASMAKHIPMLSFHIHTATDLVPWPNGPTAAAPSRPACLR